MMKKLWMILCCALIVFLPGCASLSMPDNKPNVRVVTEIDIRWENGAESGRCRYTDPRKLTMALNCLRQLELWDAKGQDPDAAPGTRYRIEVMRSDGSTRVYEQIGSQYLRKDHGPWQTISGPRGLRLALTLAVVPSDTI